jgi:hypothetical protein
MARWVGAEQRRSDGVHGWRRRSCDRRGSARAPATPYTEGRGGAEEDLGGEPGEADLTARTRWRQWRPGKQRGAAEAWTLARTKVREGMAQGAL